MEISVFNNYGEIRFDYLQVIDDVQAFFTNLCEVSLILVDTREIQKINLEYRHLDAATDVISFEANEDEYLGDIFICIDKVYEQSKLYEHSDMREFAFLLVHGILHLQGLDHQTEAQEEIMFTKQNDILNSINYTRRTNEK